MTAEQFSKSLNSLIKSAEYNGIIEGVVMSSVFFILFYFLLISGED